MRRAALGAIRLVLGNGVRVDLLSLVALSIKQTVDALNLGEGKYLLRHLRDDEYASELAERRASYEKAPFAPWNLESDPKRWWTPIVYRPFDLREWVENSQWKVVCTVDEIVFEGQRVDFLGAQEDQFELVVQEFGLLLANLLAFFHDRLKVTLRDQGVSHDIIDACLAMPGNDDLTLLVMRATALSEVLKTEDGANLLQGFKRANNILSQAEAKDGVEYSFGAELKFAETDEERALFAALDKAEAMITPAMGAEDFGTAMAAMAALRGPIDAFFTAVQVNSDNGVVRRNRLNLLHRIRAICSGVADLSRIEG